jgi:hypothetical protein
MADMPRVSAYRLRQYGLLVARYVLGRKRPARIRGRHLFFLNHAAVAPQNAKW